MKKNKSTFSVLLLYFFVFCSFSYSQEYSVVKGSIFRADDFVNSAKTAVGFGDINKDNMCLSFGRFTNNGEWVLDKDGKYLKFVGEGKRKVSFLVFCDVGNKFIENFLGSSNMDFKESYIQHCRSFYEDSEEIKCVVILNSVETVIEQKKDMSFFLFLSCFAIAIFLIVLLLFANNFWLKVIYLTKFTIFVVFFIFLNFSNLLSKFLTSFIVLVFLFIQANISISPFILEFFGKEEKWVKLVSFAILSIEFTLLFFDLFIIWKSGFFETFI